MQKNKEVYYIKLLAPKLKFELVTWFLSQHISGWIIEKEENRRVSAIGYIKSPKDIDGIKEILNKKEFENISYIIQTEHEVNWLKQVKKDFSPIEVGEMFIVIPPWYKNKINSTQRVKVKINPGEAFGTGRHESTQIVVECIEYLKKGGKLKPGNLLDVGCGSGILSIIGILSGMKRAIAIDIDRMALYNAKLNIKINKLTKEIFLIQGDLSNLPLREHKFNLTLANLQRDLFIKYVEPLTETLNRGGYLIISGILLKESPEIMRYYERRVKPIHYTTKNEWVGVIYYKK